MKVVQTKDLAEKMRNGEDVLVIDVREGDEVAQGKIPGARHIRLGDISERLDELDKNQHYYMVCRSGGRSGKASEFLTEKGYSVTNVNGGMLNWEDEVEK